MGDFNHVSKLLFSPPASPTHSPKNKRKLEETTPKPNTPQPNASKKNRSASYSGSKSVELDSNKLEFGEGGSRSVPLELESMVANMEQMVKMLRRVSGMKGFMCDPVMACLVSAQTVIMACTAELVSRRASQPDLHNKGCSTKTAANGNEQIKKVKKSEPKN